MKGDQRFTDILSRRRLLQRGALSSAGLLALWLTGCGGGDDEDPTSTPTTAVAATTPTGTPVPTETATVEPTDAEPTATDEPAEPTPTATETPTPAPEEPTSTPTPEPSPTPLPDKIWEQVQPDQPSEAQPSARRDHSLVASPDGSMLLLFGGRDAAGPLGDVWVFGIEENIWKPLRPEGGGPAPRFGHNAAYDLASNQMLIFGGQAGSTFFNDTWGFDMAANTWTQYAPDQPLPEQRYGAASAYDSANGSFFVSHGFTSQGRFDDTWEFQTAGFAWSNVSPAEGPRPEKRCLVRMGADAGAQRLYLFGGQSDTQAFKGDFWTFDIAAQSWAELDIERPSPRNLYSFTLKPETGSLLLYAGASPNGPLNDVWVYDFATGSWSVTEVQGTFPSPRDSHDATWVAGSSAMFVFGGRTGDGSLLRDLWTFTLR